MDCEKCGGDGHVHQPLADDDDCLRLCDDCDGEGEVEACDHCEGLGYTIRGEADERDCEYCDGTGRREVSAYKYTRPVFLMRGQP